MSDPHAAPTGAGAKPDELHLPHGSWWPFLLACAIALLGLGIITLGQNLHMTPADQAQLLPGTEIHPTMPGMFTLVLLVGQVLEYSNLIREGHTLGSSQFMTAFFILTGTHGLHVFAGLAMLMVIQVRGRKGQFTQTRHAGPEIASMYWHFVDIVWVFVFGIVYLLNMHGSL